MYTVAITGITGKSGQYLLKKIIEEKDNLNDYKFILLCREKNEKSVNTTGYKLIAEALATENLNVNIVNADLTNQNDLEKVFSENNVDFVIHIASVKFSLNVVPAALKSGVDNFILVHTTGIYSKYKAAGEEYRIIENKINEMVKGYEKENRIINITILRPTMIYGDLNDKNISTFMKMVDKLRIFPTVNGARYDLQPVWCKDLGDAYFSVMMNWENTKGKEYILSGGAPIQLREIFNVMAKKLGVKNFYISCPFPIAYAGSWLIYAITLKKIDMREKVQRLVEPRAYPHDEATKDFGYNPATFEVGICDEIGMYKQNKR